MRLETFGERREPLLDNFQSLTRHTGVDRLHDLAGLRLLDVEVFLGGTLLRVIESALHTHPEVIEGCFRLFDAEVPTVQQLLGVELANAAVLSDPGIHQRLREGRLIGFVVTVTPVADEINDDVTLELAAVIVRELHDPDAGFGIVPVHVEDRALDHLRDVGRVGARPARGRGRREADVVVDNDVDGPTGAVPLQLRE